MKSNFRGEVLAIQPRIRLARTYDQRQHMYLGYAIAMRGEVDGVERGFAVGIGPGAQTKLVLRAGDALRGQAEPVADPRLEPVEFYRAVKLEILGRAAEIAPAAPPWQGVPPAPDVYRARGHRRLDESVYAASACSRCIWGCRMPVEIVIDPWKPAQREYRFEVFCYGPKSCPVYVAGPVRTVPGRGSAVWTEEDEVDQQATANRGPDD
jgi:hypothetical protein